MKGRACEKLRVRRLSPIPSTICGGIENKKSVIVVSVE